MLDKKGASGWEKEETNLCFSRWSRRRDRCGRAGGGACCRRSICGGIDGGIGGGLVLDLGLNRSRSRSSFLDFGCFTALTALSHNCAPGCVVVCFGHCRFLGRGGREVGGGRCWMELDGGRRFVEGPGRVLKFVFGSRRFCFSMPGSLFHRSSITSQLGASLTPAQTGFQDPNPESAAGLIRDANTGGAVG